MHVILVGGAKAFGLGWLTWGGVLLYSIHYLSSMLGVGFFSWCRCLKITHSVILYSCSRNWLPWAHYFTKLTCMAWLLCSVSFLEEWIGFCVHLPKKTHATIFQLGRDTIEAMMNLGGTASWPLLLVVWYATKAYPCVGGFPTRQILVWPSLHT